MGRPKKSDLLCTFCNKSFLKKINLEEHMKSHIDMNDNNRQSRSCSNLCSICQESFEDSEYKLHIQSEHQHELNKMITSTSNNDLFSYESGYVLLSKKRIKREPGAISSADSVGSSKRKVAKFQTEDSFNIAPADIKLEPVSDEERRITPKKKIVMKLKTPSIKCRVCGLLCKGQRGLRVHQLTHRRTQETSSDSSQSDNQEIMGKHQKSEPRRMNSAIENDGNPILLSNNDLINFNQSNQSGIICSILPINNSINVENQSNLQFLPNPGNGNVKILEVIPKFDPTSVSYIKWLKKFIYKCKIQKYPLPSVMCENINHVVNEMASYIGNPMGSLKKKSNHFYFMKLHKILSDVMLGQMRHSLTVTKKK